MKNINEKKVTVEGQLNDQKIKIESGGFAMLADSAVKVQIGETTVLATVVSKESVEETDFFPLKIDYEERYYAGGNISGSRFTRREGKPNDDAVVSGRLIDHAVRPLFDKDFMNDTQVVITVLSIDEVNDPSVVGFLAASAALSTAGVPFDGPIIPVRIERVGDKLNVGFSKQDKDADLSMVVTYLKEGQKVHAIEAHSHIVPEEEVLKAINYGAEMSLPLFALIKEFTEKVGKEMNEYTKGWLSKDVKDEYKDEIMKAVQGWLDEGLYYTDREWAVRQAKLSKTLEEKHEEKFSASKFNEIIGEVQKDWVRDMVLNQKKRIDDRKFDEIRPLSASVGLIPRVHGSALFTRGLTQSLTIATLAGPTQKQLVQGMEVDYEKRYFHHYNFPPYSTGETGKIGNTNRREVGHGMLAENALYAVLPPEEEFVYVMRTVSEILTSNGSTSMAATCGSSLALMDAGVPIKAHVAGIGVGLFYNSANENPSEEDYVLLTDIVGYEDFAGYMDFKMTGTREGMTAIQMELKTKGVPIKLLEKIFETSKKARMQVLDVLDKAISKPREKLSEYAPKVETLTIKKEDIGAVIGSGGAVIKGIMLEMGVEIDIEEKEDIGLVAISGKSGEGVYRAKAYILQMLTKPEIGQVYTGTVTRVEDYGAFVEILPKQLGLLHVSQYGHGYVANMNDEVKVGDVLEVKVNELENGKIGLTRKELIPNDNPEANSASFENRPQNSGGYSGGGRRDDRRNDRRSNSYRGNNNNRNRY